MVISYEYYRRYSICPHRACQTCLPIPFEVYDNLADQEKDQEAEKGICRIQQSVIRYIFEGVNYELETMA